MRETTPSSCQMCGACATGPQSAETMTGAVYRTTLCTLMLEVFYRYMPVNRG